MPLFQLLPVPAPRPVPRPSPASLPAAARGSRRTPAAALTAATIATVVGMAAGATGAAASAPAAPPAHVYYVSPSGDDRSSGTSPADAWRTVEAVSRARLHPGDTVLLERGARFRGRLAVRESGTADRPIRIDAYGSGTVPTVTAGRAGACVLLAGDHIRVRHLGADACAYSGFTITGSANVILNSEATRNAVGIRVARGSAHNSLQANRLIDNNRMAVNTPGTDCGGHRPRRCDDDSGATAVLLNGDDNNVGYNYVRGSVARSFDYGYDGSAFEIFDASDNVIHDNVSVDNLVLSELGRTRGHRADGNVYRRNTVTAACGPACASAGGITLRGGGSAWGPQNGTVIDRNTFRLAGARSQGIVCHGGCPASTVVTGNTISAFRAAYLDGSGWTFRGNALLGSTVAQLGKTWIGVPKGHRIVR